MQSLIDSVSSLHSNQYSHANSSSNVEQPKAHVELPFLHIHNEEGFDKTAANLLIVVKKLIG
jgi:hypothetical protein